jgi:hypothetical protein
MNEFQALALKTLAYADVFDYPLTAPEIWKFLITEKRIDPERFLREILEMRGEKKQVVTDGPFFCLPGRKKIIALRKKRQRWSQKKLKIARRVAKWLKLIPWIKMIAVTGNLAMENSDRGDDIDLLVVMTKNRLWLTRFFTVLLVELVSHRRRPGDKEAKDKICLNMFLDETHLAVPKKERDLFSAHEVCQLKVIWEKDNLYQKFLKKNQWIKEFLPNWRP